MQVGIFLWELIAGRHVWEWESCPSGPLRTDDVGTMRELIVRRRRRLPPLPPVMAGGPPETLRRAIDALIQSCLAFAADSRPQAIEVLNTLGQIEVEYGAATGTASVAVVVAEEWGYSMQRQALVAQRVPFVV